MAIEVAPSLVRVAIRLLVVLVAIGVALRIVAAVALWPASPALGDSWPYAYYAAASDPLANPQHPAGYSLFLSVVGLVTREVAAFVTLQQLIGIASGVILFAGVRRLTGSPWPALAAAATVLLSADLIYLERTIMSETLFVGLLSLVVYAAARALDAPERWWPWPAIAGLLVAVATMTRSAGLVLLPLIAVVFLLARPGPWRGRWQPAATLVAVAGAVLIAYGVVNVISRDRFEIAPTPGWHLYARVAPFADCGQFDPPTATVGLCEFKDPDARPGADWYLFDERSPAALAFGQFNSSQGAGDAQLGSFARRSIAGQPKTYLAAVASDVKTYFVPGGWTWKTGLGAHLDGQVDWTAKVNVDVERATKGGMEVFFDRFSVSRDRDLLSLLHDYQRVFRVGATLLTIATLLTLIGLFVGTRRQRVAVLLLGVGGLMLFALPTLSVIYVARYTIPSAALMIGAAVTAAMALQNAVAVRIATRNQEVT